MGTIGKIIVSKFCQILTKFFPVNIYFLYLSKRNDYVVNTAEKVFLTTLRRILSPDLIRDPDEVERQVFSRKKKKKRNKTIRVKLFAIKFIVIEFISIETIRLEESSTGLLNKYIYTYYIYCVCIYIYI